jgi:hypothetical protein
MRMIPGCLEVAASPELVARVEQGAAAVASPVSDALVAELSRELGQALLGVIFYGSHLNQTAGPRSDWDFFVVVESYRAAHRSWLHARLDSVLPPGVYGRELTLGDGSRARCKLSFVSAPDLDRYTSASAPDSYLFGRLSKRVALVFARDDRARHRIIRALAGSAALCAGWALAGASQGLDVEALAQDSVAFSYRCEERVEGPSRSRKLFDTDAEYFRDVYRRVVAAQVAAGGATIDAAGLVKRSGREAARRAERAAVAAFVRRSRRRARMRWLKNVATFEGWEDYMLVKLERHQGIEISLSDRERRHPLLAAVRHYLRLRRQGRLSGTGRERGAGDSA